MNLKTKRNIKDLLYTYFFPHYKRISIIVFFILIASILNLVDPLIIRYIIDKVILNRELSKLLGIIIFSLIMKFLHHFIILYSDYLISLTTGDLSKNLVTDLYKHIQTLSMDFFDSTKLGNILQRINEDTFIVAEDLFYVLVQLISASFIIITGFIFIFYLNIKLALVSIIILPLFAYFIKFIGKKYKEVVFKDRELYDYFSSTIQENLSSIQLIKELGIENKILEKISTIRDAIKHNTIKIYLFSNISKNGTAFFNYLGPMTILFYGSFLYFKNEISLGELTSFFYFISQLYDPISSLVENQLNFHKATTSIDRIYEYLNLKPSITNYKETINDIGSIKASIEFLNVTFSYKNNNNVLKNISFRINEHECVAFVGMSGSGKSTITKLIFRLYEVNSGTIKVGNNDIKHYDIKKLRDNIAIVSQNTILFHASIKENLEIVNNKVNNDEIVKACKIANIHDFIMSLPKKYDTIIGEKGTKLSGGQRQRLSIARAILKGSKILILDEATSQLDSETEKSIKEAFENFKNKITLIIIAHRLSTITSCDKIFVLENGTISDIGSHKYLLGKNKLYKKLWNSQIK